MSKRKFPETLAGAEVSDIDLGQEDFQFQGERLTEERAGRLAEEHFGRSRNLVPGGKSLSGDGSHSPVVQARVSFEVRTRLDAIAERRGVRTSRLLREAIDQFIEREEAAG